MKITATVLATLLCAPLAHATVISSYALGEAGSVGNVSPFLNLVDSVGPVSNDIDSYQNIAQSSVTIVSPGSGGAPGSTAAISISQSPTRNAGFYMSTNSHALTDNWDLEFWFKTPNLAGPSNGWVVAATDTTTSGVSVELFNGKFNLLTGNFAVRYEGSTPAASYSVDTWYKINLRDIDNELNLYVNDVSVVTVTSAQLPYSDLGRLMLGFGPGAPAQRGVNGTFDEVRVAAVPEPSSVAVPLGLGFVAVLGRRRRR